MLDSIETQRPIVAAKDLTPAVFEALMKRHSCLMVRGLFSMTEVLNLRAVAVETYKCYDQGVIDTQNGGPPAEKDYIIPDAYVGARKHVGDFRRFGSLVLSFCPMAAGTIGRALSRSAVVPCVEQYFKSSIGLSMNSSSVRFSERTASVPRVFHQDGNFLGGIDAETINCWVALDPCGVVAPAMEVFPQRLNELLPAGEEGARVTWEIAEELVYDRMGKENAWIPEFLPGDVFLFDHMHVHRTHLTERMTRDRHAFECWMFPTKERYSSELMAWLG